MRPRVPLIFLYVMFLTVSILHTIWAGMLLAGGGAAGATALSGITTAIPGPHSIDALVMICCSAMAASVILGPRPIKPLWALGLIPQQILLAMAAWASLSALLDSQFADGVERPWLFIAAGEMPILLVAAIHNVVVVAFEASQFRAAGTWPWKE